LLQVGENFVNTSHPPEVRLILKFSVDRRQIINARILERMAAIIKNRHISRSRGASEIDGNFSHSGLIEIHALNHFESGPPKGSRNVFSIMAWISQVRRVPIFPITDDEGDALVRECLSVRKKPQPRPQQG
jgi:hypothetical protein